MVEPRDGQPFKLTEARWQRYTRLLKQYEGWGSALRAEFGNDVVTFLSESECSTAASRRSTSWSRSSRARTPRASRT